MVNEKILSFLSQAGMVIVEDILSIVSKITGSKIIYDEFENNFNNITTYREARESIVKLFSKFGNRIYIKKGSDDIDMYFISMVSLKNTLNLDDKFLDDAIDYAAVSIENGYLANRHDSLNRMLNHIYDRLELSSFIGRNSFIDKIVSDLDKVKVGSPLLKILSIGGGIGIAGLLGKLSYDYYKKRRK
ncbi:MAG: hypothetical protein QXD03_02200 [Candidatus Anstonellales archaeon]